MHPAIPISLSKPFSSTHQRNWYQDFVQFVRKKQRIFISARLLCTQHVAQPFAFLVCLLLHLSILGVAIKGAMSFSSQKKIARSRRVLATTMDDGQESLLALAPSTSLRPWVQQRLGVTLVDSRTPIYIQTKLRRTVVLTSFSQHLDPLQIPA